MMKKWIAVVLMLMVACAPAYAMDKAASLPDWDSLDRYASFEENGTVWTVRSNPGQAALARISAETAPYSGYACFGLELTGDSATGVTVPVLAFYYAGSVELNGEYASIAVDGKRYDLALANEKITLGRNKAERMTAALDEAGLDMVRAMLAAEEIAIALTGDTTFVMEPEKKETYASTKAELAACSLDALEDMLNEFSAIGEYHLWDINALWFERMTGVEPQIQAVPLPEEEIELNEELTITLDEPMFMLSRGDTNNDVRDLQKLLISAGYIQGTADGGYGEGTVRAVRAAQKWLGMMPTGCADAALITALTDGGAFVGPNGIYNQKDAEVYAAEGLCELTVERHWIADAVESVGGDRRTASDADDTLVVYEGTVKNLSVDELDFYWQLSAVVSCGEYEFPCVLVCERNDGASLTSALPPMGEARMLIYAEVPEVFAKDAEWSLEITAGDTVITVE